MIWFIIFLTWGWAGSNAFGREKKITNYIGMTFIRVNPGSYHMGSPVSEPGRQKDEIRHRVTIDKPFYLQETEVTLKQWWAVMGKKWINPRKGDPDAPVTRVSFYDVQNYIKKLNYNSSGTYRLPTEKEWEYACRAGTETAYSFGKTIGCADAVFGNNSTKDARCIPLLRSKGIKANGPAPVKKFSPNAWGFYDMHGNVWEWCSDSYAPYRANTDGSNYSLMDSDSKVRRGGSWYKSGTLLRSANRTYAHPASKFATTGFRLVIEAGE